MGLDYITKEGLHEDIAQFKTNYQDLPDSVPDVKGYTGWDAYALSIWMRGDN
ncbi:hypothetical protein ACVXG7_20560 [Enterobacter hormaechei]